MVLVGVRLHDVTDALLADDLGDDVVSQRPNDLGGIRQAAASQVNFGVRLHLHESEHLLVARLVDKAGSEQVIDARGLGGHCSWRVRAAPRKLGAQLLIVQDQPVAVVSNFQLVARLHICRSGKVGTHPGGKPHPSVRSRGQLRPVQSAQSGVSPVQVSPAVRAEEGVRHPDLEQAQLGRTLQMHGFAHVKFEVAVSARNPFP